MRNNVETVSWISSATGWLTFATTADLIAFIGGVVGIAGGVVGFIFTILRIITWLDDRSHSKKKKKLETDILELEKKQLLESKNNCSE